MELASRVLTAVSIAVVVIAVALGVWAAASLLLVLFGSILVAVGLTGLTRLMARGTGLDHSRSLVLVVGLLTMATVTAGFLLAPSILEQADQMTRALPRALREVELAIARSGWAQWLLQDQAMLAAPDGRAGAPWGRRAPAAAIVEKASDEGLFTWAGSVAGDVLSGTGAVLLMLVMGLYLAAQPQSYQEGAVTLLPRDRRERARQVLHEMKHQLRWWLLGQASSMVVVGLFTTTGLLALGVPMPLALGLLTAALCFIPNFGPLLSAIAAGLVAITPGKVPEVIALYIVVQTVESYLITPLIQRRAVDLPPVTLIGSQVILGAILGFPGLAAAAPLVVVLRVAVQRLYREDLLGDVTVT